MPELPEVETVAQGLHQAVEGRTFTGVTIRWPRTIAKPAVHEFSQRIVGRRVLAVGRRGKYVRFGLDQGYLLIHLKMSGRLLVAAVDDVPDQHVHTIFDLDNGQQLWFRDVRKFGRVYLVDQLEEVTGALGPEPLEATFTLAEFRDCLSRRSGRLKSLLLNQEFVAGLGNIYADEALFAAGLHPLRRADTLSPDEQARLYGAIRRVLREAIVGRGTTLDDGGYRDAAGQPGSYQEQIFVYGRSGEACRRCQTPIERIVIGGRSSHFCPCCQPA
jgi:formamidopyrimidine-DNA glycosylase